MKNREATEAATIYSHLLAIFEEDEDCANLPKLNPDEAFGNFRSIP